MFVCRERRRRGLPSLADSPPLWEAQVFSLDGTGLSGAISDFTAVIVHFPTRRYSLKHFCKVSDLCSIMNNRPNTNSIPKKPPMVQPIRMA
ncbi:hypothetical protein INR49_012860 [Caranx melampygus]|nr:hypothetical protein INR49_012860 [Caranx melampygus]